MIFMVDNVYHRVHNSVIVCGQYEFMWTSWTRSV